MGDRFCILVGGVFAGCAYASLSLASKLWHVSVMASMLGIGAGLMLYARRRACVLRNSDFALTLFFALQRLHDEPPQYVRSPFCGVPWNFPLS
jgi:hypothetical protein